MKTFALVVMIGVMTIFAFAYHFFGLHLLVDNQTRYKVSRVECEAKTGSVLEIEDLNHGERSNRLLFLASGDVLECEFSVDGFERQSGLVVGYFTERIDRVDIVIKESPSGAIVEIVDKTMADNEHELNVLRLKSSKLQ